MGIAFAGQIPIEPGYAEMSDEGRFADVDNGYIAQAMELLRGI